MQKRRPSFLGWVTTEYTEGTELFNRVVTPSSPSAAFRTAIAEGTIEADRIADDADMANEKGLMSNEKCARIAMPEMLQKLFDFAALPKPSPDPGPFLEKP